ncbi:MAG: carboxymuconolactone decarboxylase family protein [Deltaproteobacteria bacterium]|nr:carboxymuconolactone decarboxylase family protein [Deltaproteobacteria bacterium]
MEERTRLLVSLGAAVAANCVPCFEHFLGKTEAAGLTSQEIQEAADIGDQVKNGARITIMSSIRSMIGAGASPCNGKSEKSCCG